MYRGAPRTSECHRTCAHDSTRHAGAGLDDVAAYRRWACVDDGSTRFWILATAFFAAHVIAVQRVLTDNAFAYPNSVAFRTAVLESGAVQRFIRPRRPQTNGKMERFNRTLLKEWAYVRPYLSKQTRSEALTAWLHIYNHHRAHAGLGQLTAHLTFQQRPWALHLASRSQQAL
jgi:hypothetical protein